MEANGKGAVHVPPGEGKALWMSGGTYTLKATSEDTGGSLLVMEAIVPLEGGPPPHLHTRMDEAFWVLEGEVEMQIPDEDRTFVATAGSFVFIPRGTARTYRNVGTERPRMLAIATPAGFEGFLEEVGRPAGDGVAPPPGPEELERALAAAPKYDLEPAPLEK